MIPVNGRPLIHRSILLLKSAGIEEVLIDTCHMADFIFDRLPDGTKLGVKLQYYREAELSGIPAGLKRAQKYLNGEAFVVMDDCVIADLDLADVITYHHEQEADATIVLRAMPGAKTHGSLDADGQASLSALIGDSPDESGYLCPTGIRVFSPRIFEFIPDGCTRSLAETLSLMVQAGCQIEGYVMDGFWAELTTWEKYGQLLWQVGRGFVPEPPE